MSEAAAMAVKVDEALEREGVTWLPAAGEWVWLRCEDGGEMLVEATGTAVCFGGRVHVGVWKMFPERTIHMMRLLRDVRPQ